MAADRPRVKQTLKALRFAPLAIADVLWRARNRNALGAINTQQPSILVTSLTSRSLQDEILLAEHSETVHSGSNAIYVYPSKDQRGAFGLTANYPVEVGLKILRDFRPPQEARYLHPDKQGIVRTALIGTAGEALAAANYLAAAGVGPKIWDIAELRTTDGGRGTAFVCEHVPSFRPASAADHAAFMATLGGLVQDGPLSITYPGWRNTPDFQPPDCNGNLIVGKEGPVYVDFQNFRVDQVEWLAQLVATHATVSHFGESRVGRPDRYLYQSVPGSRKAAKRNVARRWQRILGALREHGIQTEGRVVLDIGTNLGMLLHEALAAGAHWALGWDQPDVAAAANDVLTAAGDSRFTVVGRHLDERSDLTGDVPRFLRNMLDESILLYLSVHQHVGFLDWVRSGRWRALVYEGHDGESIDDAAAHLRRLVPGGVRVGQVRLASDGDSGARPYVVVTR